MKRRAFIGLFGGAAAWPLAGRAQPAATPVIGYMSAGSPGPIAQAMTVFRKSLAEAGYVEGRNLAIEYRWAEGRYERLPAMAAEFVRRELPVIVATPTASALAAKAATATVPIVFGSTDDPVKLGLVASLARPGGNATGVHFFLSELAAKQLGLLRELAPAAARIGLMINPDNANAEAVQREVMAAASTLGVAIELAPVRDSLAMEAAFAALAANGTRALLIGADPFFFTRRLQLATLATRHAIAAVYNVREFAEAGGLLSYGTSLTEVYRHIGSYAGRILNGARPADLPVIRSTKFELVINLATARALGLEVSPALIARADEVIE